MIAALLAVCLSSAVATPQGRPEEPSPGIETLVGRLADDRPDVRSDAARKLLALGPSALPALRKLSPPRDVNARAMLADVIRGLEETETIPPYRGVTLDAEALPARAVILNIAGQAGIPPTAFNFGRAGGAPVTVSLKDATPLQAVDEVCRKSPALSCQPGIKPELPSLDFFPAPFQDRPTSYVRHYRVRVLPTGIVAKNQDSATLNLEVTWSPHVRPFAMTSIQDLVVSDDRGRVLSHDLPRGRGSQSFPIEVMRQHHEFAVLRLPAEDAKSLTAKGGVEFRYPRERSDLVFEAPADNKGKVLQIEGAVVTLKEVQLKDGEVRFEVETFEKADAQIRSHFSRAEAVAVTESGARLTAGFNTGVATRGQTSQWFWVMKRPTEEPIREFRLGYVKTFCVDRVDFEIRDIPVPK